MSMFNKIKRKNNKTINKAGGEAFVQSAEMQLASLLLTSFAQDQFYRSSKQTFSDLTKLLVKVDSEFAAKAAIYARNEFGMRSITHVLAGELAAYASGKTWAKDFYTAIIKRPDDMLEIASYYYANGGKNLPNAMKKGFAKAFDKFDAYQLAKYQGNSKAVKLVDLVNIVHPFPTQRNAKALTDLVNGNLKNTDTWEAKLSEAGQVAESETEKAKNKAKAWASLVLENKLGYFALLRNLRNILVQAPKLTNDVCKQLTNRARIKNSLVLPFRYLSAMDAIKDIDGYPTKKVLKALSTALEISLDNVPKFEGKTLIALDDSGSMTWAANKKLNRTPMEIGSIFAAMLYKSNDADLMTFSDHATYESLYTSDSAIGMADRLVKGAVNGGTNFHSIFNKAKKSYDRIIILSDMQGWIGHYSPVKAFEVYKKNFKSKPYIYSFDLSGQGSLQFPEYNVFALAGFSDKIFDIMKLLEKDKKALVNTIKAVDL